MCLFYTLPSLFCAGNFLCHNYGKAILFEQILPFHGKWHATLMEMAMANHFNGMATFAIYGIYLNNILPLCHNFI